MRQALYVGLLTVSFLAVIGFAARAAAQTSTTVYESAERSVAVSDTRRTSPEGVAKELIVEMSEKYGVDHMVLYNTIMCETAGTFDPTIQARARLWYGREQSYGLAQIHLPDHPSVTYEQAIDPRFAVEFMAKNMAEGHGNWWVCYRQYAVPKRT